MTTTDTNDLKRTATRRRDLKPGDVITLELPYSEVCMHLRVAGQVRQVELHAGGAQILDDDGSPFSFPIGWGEAGIYRQENQPYAYVTETVYVGNYPRRCRRLHRAMSDTYNTGSRRAAIRSAYERLGLAYYGH